jgi:hypothetical protein
MHVVLCCVVCLVGSGFFDEPITHSEESYWLCVFNCVWSRYLKRGGLGTIWAVAPQKILVQYVLKFYVHRTVHS